MKHIDFTVAIGKRLIDARVDYDDNPHHISDNSMELHEHLLYEIYFIQKGSMMLQLEKTILSLKEGDIFVISPHIPHKVLGYDEDMVRFNVQFMCNIEYTVPYMFFCPQEAIRDEIFSQISYIRRYLNDHANKASLFRMNHAFSIVLSYVVEPMLPPDSFVRAMPKNNRMKHLIIIDQFFFMRYAEPITILDLAAELNYSETQTRRILQEYTGMSFADKLRQHRISAARQYLVNSSLSVDEIAERCGYQSRMGFESMFKKLVGMSPHKYREQEQKRTT